MNHGHLDQVSRRTLQWGIDRISLCKTPHGHVAAIDVTQVAPAAKNGFHVFLRSCLFNGSIHVLLDRRKLGEIGIDDFLCLPSRNG